MDTYGSGMMWGRRDREPLWLELLAPFRLIYWGVGFIACLVATAIEGAVHCITGK